MIDALSFLLDFEKIEDDDDDSCSEDEPLSQQPQVILNKESVYKAKHKGTTSNKKKKKAKLERVIRSMKKQQRLSSERTDSNYYSPLNHFEDTQGFVEKLFSRLKSSTKRFELVRRLQGHDGDVTGEDIPATPEKIFRLLNQDKIHGDGF